METVYEMRTFGSRKFWMPEDWRDGELVTWEQLQKDRWLGGVLVQVVPPERVQRVGIVTGMELDDVHRGRTWSRRMRHAYFTMNILVGDKMCELRLSCNAWEDDISPMTSLPPTWDYDDATDGDAEVWNICSWNGICFRGDGYADKPTPPCKL